MVAEDRDESAHGWLSSFPAESHGFVWNLSRDGIVAQASGPLLPDVDPVGAPVWECLCPETPSHIVDGLKRALTQGGGDVVFPLGAHLKDASWFRAKLSAHPTEAHATVLAGFEITEQKNLETRYRLTLEILQRFAAILDIDELLSEVARACRDVFGFYNVNVGVIRGTQVVVRAGHGGYTSSLDGAFIGEARFDIHGPGIVAHVASTAASYVCDDIRDDPHYLDFEPLPHVLSEAAVPLITGGNVVGVIDIESDRLGGIDKEDIALIEALAGPIAVAVEKADLYARVQNAAKRYHDLYDHAPDMYLTVARDGQMLACNQTGADMLGYAKAELVGLDTARLFAAASWEAFQNLLGHVFDKSPDTRTLDAIMRRRDGSLIDVTLTASRVAGDRDDEPTCRLLIKDVTEKLRLEREVLHTRKMESLGTLAHGIAHDFNNLLGSILGFTSYLKTIVEEPSEVSECLDIIEQTVERGTEITERLQTFSKKGEHTRKVFPLDGLLADAFTLMKRTFDKKIVLSKEIASDLPPLIGDPGEIQQVLINLCFNARDAMPDGGTLTLSARGLPDDDPDLVVLPKAEHSWIALDVSDTGHGVSPDVTDKIFEPFFTTKSKDKGTGLGLSLAYGIVKRHGGRIVVKPSPPKGTCFRVILPAWPFGQPSASQDSDNAPVPYDVPTGCETVMVIDDERNIRKFVSAALGNLGYRVIEADGGEAALAVLKGADGKSVALTILDLAMPHMSGEETLEAMRGLCPDLKCIISSGFYTEEKSRELIVEGAQAFLPKPYTVEKLAAVVRETLDR